MENENNITLDKKDINVDESKNDNSIPDDTTGIKVSTNDSIEDEDGIPNPDKVTDDNYKEVFDKYDISDADAAIMLEVIEKYRKNIKCNYYEMLPKEFKGIADGVYRMAKAQGDTTMTHNSAAKFVISQLVNDAEINAAFDEYKNAVTDAVSDMNSEYNKLIIDAFNDVFNNIEEIEVTDPEKAEKIKSIKSAFDDAITFDRQLAFINGVTSNKLNKLLKRYDNEVSYFNKTVNSTDVRIPDIRDLVDIIFYRVNNDSSSAPTYKVDDIKKLIIAICKTTAYTLDVSRNVEDLAYVYRLVNNIYVFKYLDKSTDAESEALLFGNITKVLDCIKNK